MIPYLERYDYSDYITKLDSVLVDVLKDSALENKKIIKNFSVLLSSDSLPEQIKISEIYEKWCVRVQEKIDRDKIDNYDYEGGIINTTLNVEVVSSSWNDYKKHIVTFECEEYENLNIEFMLYGWEKYGEYHQK